MKRRERQRLLKAKEEKAAAKARAAEGKGPPGSPPKESPTLAPEPAPAEPAMDFSLLADFNSQMKEVEEEHAAVVADLEAQLKQAKEQIEMLESAHEDVEGECIRLRQDLEMANVRIGQPVTFTVDALNHLRLRGHVQRISPATGSEFSLLQADNATGNFVKIAQRIPVRITVDPDQAAAQRLRPGMSVVVSIDTGYVVEQDRTDPPSDGAP